METKPRKVRPLSADVLYASIAMGDWYDAWGTGVEYMFAICHVLWHDSAEEIPAEWEYNHGPVYGCDLSSEDDGYVTTELHTLYVGGLIDDEALLYWGNVLNRYLDILRHYGHSY